MSQYTNLLATINAQIKANGVGAITGPLLNAVLRQMVSVLGDGYRLVGVAAPGDNPGTPDNQVAYLAGQDGTYTNFGGITLSGEVALLVWGASWSKQSLFSIDSAVTPGSGNPVSSDAVDAALTALAGEYQKLVPTAVEGHLAEFDGSGQVRDAGVSLDELPANFAACLYDRRSAGTPQSPYIFRQSGGDGVDYLKRIKGRTLVWNQLVQNGDFSDGTTGWGFQRATGQVSNKILTLTTSDSPASSTQMNRADIPILSGHTYFISFFFQGLITEKLRVMAGGTYAVLPTYNYTAVTSERMAGIFTAPANYNYIAFYANANGTAPASTAICRLQEIQIIDLTLLGWVPSTAEEFRAVYPLSYYAYTPALLINNAATDLESTGFNQWDEVAEEGNISTTDGQDTPFTGLMRTKNYIRVIPGGNYYFRISAAQKPYRLYYYNAAKNYLGYVTWQNSLNVIIPSDTYYIRFVLDSSYGTTYNHDICINLSDASRNGIYEPYWKATRHLGLDSIQAKEVGSDTIVTINGLDGVEQYSDKILDGKILQKELRRYTFTGNETWVRVATGWNCKNILTGCGPSLSPFRATTSKITVITNGSSYPEGVSVEASTGETAAAVAAAMSGQSLCYPLATPKEYELVEPIQPMLEVDELGTERRLPEDTAAAVNAPFESDSNYSVSVANLVRKLSE